jgi:hypothetical protein
VPVAVYAWTTIKDVYFAWSSHSVPTSYTYQTSNRYKYRVRASNPVGKSDYASYNIGNRYAPASTG